MRASRGIRYLFEPDNEKISPLAWLLKQEMHRFPILSKDADARSYWQLWNTIFHGWPADSIVYRFLERYIRFQASRNEAHIGDKCGFIYLDGNFHSVSKKANRQPFTTATAKTYASVVQKYVETGAVQNDSGPLIVKTVHSFGALSWLSTVFSPDILVVLRNPHSLYASYRRLRMPDGFRNIMQQYGVSGLQTATQLPTLASLEEHHEIAGQIAITLKLLERQIAAHPEWQIVSHDRLCLNPLSEFRDLFDRVGLQWSSSSERAFHQRNKSGQGFTPDRVTSMQPDKWRNELTAEEVEMIDKWIENLDLSGFLEEYVY